MRSAEGGDARRGWQRRRSGSAAFVLALSLMVLALCTLSTVARAAENVYVTNSVDINVSQYAIGIGGGLSPLSPATVPAGSSLCLPGPVDVALTPDARSAYVVNFECPNAVWQYNVDALTGALSSKTPTTVPTGAGSLGVAVTPDGKNAYVTNAGSSTISQYSIDPLTGVLARKTPATVASSGCPWGVAVSPDGKSAYAVNDCVGSVSQYNIDPLTGALSPKTAPTVTSGSGPRGITVTPDGKSAYVTNESDNTVSQYSIDPVSGVLSPKVPATVATEAPESVAVTPNGKSAYVTNIGDDTVSEYNVNPLSGVLSPKNPATVAAGRGPWGVAVTPDGKSAYVTNEETFQGTVSQYNIGSVTGALSPKTPATVATGARPEGVAVTPLPRAHATSTNVSCSPRVFAPGDATVCTVTVTDTANAGQSTPTGMVSFTNSGTGSFYGRPCTLSGSGSSASCAAIFTSFARGGQGVTASYSGDSTHDTSAGSTIVVVAVPASTDRCVVFGHGRITAANGDKASFRGLVAATLPRGVEFYRDNGPANRFRVRSTNVDAVTCNPEATKASVFGTATVNGAGSVEYRIDIQLTASEWGKDMYRIRLSSGYDSGAQEIRHGDVDIHIRDSEHHHHDPNADH